MILPTKPAYYWVQIVPRGRWYPARLYGDGTWGHVGSDYPQSGADIVDWQGPIEEPSGDA